MSDIKAMGFKDVHTLIDVMKNKASGELQDDKTYLMEHTIQVSYCGREFIAALTRRIACQRFAFIVEDESGSYQRVYR